MKHKLYEYGELYPATLIRRFKRFLMDVRLPNGEVESIFCPNTGSMLGCSASGAQVMLSLSESPKRKTRYTLEMIQADGVWIGVNTHLTNRIAEQLIKRSLGHGPIGSCPTNIKREWTHGNSRLDFLLSYEDRRCCVEVKNVTLTHEETALFPDAITARGTKHLKTLMELAGEKTDACMIYIVQRPDCSHFSPAKEIDPEYAKTLGIAMNAGVHCLAYRFEVAPDGVYLLGRLPVSA